MDEEYLKDILKKWLKRFSKEACDALQKIVKDQLGEMQFVTLLSAF